MEGIKETFGEIRGAGKVLLRTDMAGGEFEYRSDSLVQVVYGIVQSTPYSFISLSSLRQNLFSRHLDVASHPHPKIRLCRTSQVSVLESLLSTVNFPLFSLQSVLNTTSQRITMRRPTKLAPEQERFYRRSLARNDVELTAILKLNAQCKELRQQIVDNCGASVLQHLPLYKLNEKDELQGTNLPDHPKLVVDFMLRTKLRRRLLNRVIRRLLRTAHALDGQDASAPGAPRYGDQVVRPRNNITEFEQRYQQQQLALSIVVLGEGESVGKQEVQKEETPVKEEDGIKQEEEAAIKQEDDQAKKQQQVEKELSQAISTLQDYKEVYNRLVDPNTHQLLAYPILRQPHDVQSGVGGTSRMTNAELMAEERRWRTNLLSKIPEQPSFRDLQPALWESTMVKDENVKEEEEEDVKQEEEDVEMKDKEVDEAEDKEGDDGNKPNDNDEEVEDEDDNKKKKKEILPEVIPKRIRPMSLQPVPSFYDQDIKRIRRVHAEMFVATAQKDNGRKLDLLNKAYNTGEY